MTVNKTSKKKKKKKFDTSFNNSNSLFSRIPLSKKKQKESKNFLCHGKIQFQIQIQMQIQIQI